jgi:hypothetical protein
MQADTSITAIVEHLRSGNKTCSSATLATIASGYHHFLRQNQMLLHQDRLAILQPVKHNHALLALLHRRPYNGSFSAHTTPHPPPAIWATTRNCNASACGFSAQK